MRQEHQRWYSPALGRDMNVLVLGHAGAKLLVFPTTGGTFREWYDRNMHWVLGDHIENGWLQMYLVDPISPEAWYNRGLHPGARAWRQRQYDQYLRDEVIPFTYSRNPNDFVIATGASFGAYDAAVFAFRNPQIVNRLVGMSGLYDIREMTGGFSDETVFSVNPMEFMAHEHDWGRLDAFRRQDIIFATGETDYYVEQNRAFSAMLWQKGIGNALRIWDGFAHDWPAWERMLRLYVGGHD